MAVLIRKYTSSNSEKMAIGKQESIGTVDTVFTGTVDEKNN